ncbi:MAG: DUF1080 domain-containing protein [Verrucomicrobia bacterium]|nr:DUF1080 domain-containing protein [Verrucomicrobiota bacterium]MDA1067021.1 DUF1080 domain-containing protein [Verrucomicrobiota bacterium]
MRISKLASLFLFTLITGSLSFGNQHKSEEEWISLFNGKDLSGWTASKENPDSYAVKNKTLVLKGGRSHLFYTGSIGNANFKNFELKLRVKTTPQANSGIYFHTKYQDEGWPTQGFECQVNTSQKDPKKTGSLYAIANIYVAMKPEPPFTVRVDKAGAQIWQEKAPSVDGEWFDYHITVIDDTVTLMVNGKTTVQWTQPEGWVGPKGMEGRVLGNGTIALQAHDPDSEVHYQDIKIKLLD